MHLSIRDKSPGDSLLPSRLTVLMSEQMAWPVRSAQLLSNGSFPHPRQNVGKPPSVFCISTSHLQPLSMAEISLLSPEYNSSKASIAPGVSSASGTDPEKLVHPHPPGLAPLNG